MIKESFTYVKWTSLRSLAKIIPTKHVIRWSIRDITNGGRLRWARWTWMICNIIIRSSFYTKTLFGWETLIWNNTQDYIKYRCNNPWRNLPHGRMTCWWFRSRGGGRITSLFTTCITKAILTIWTWITRSIGTPILASFTWIKLEGYIMYQ